MDSILVLGKVEDKLEAALKKMGYDVHSDCAEAEVVKYIEDNFIDLLFLSTTGRRDTVSLCKKLRAALATRKLPIILISDNQSVNTELEELVLENIEIVKPDIGLGMLISKVATALRLRKMAGADNDSRPSLSEVNAHLRDLTEKHKRELEDAKRIQANLLPKDLPKSKHFEIEACYIPLDDLGGDWYYVQETEDKKLSLMIADVTGHGLPAAFIGSMTKMAMVATNKTVPDELLTGMNKLMSPQIPQGNFVTMGAALYDPLSGQVDFCRAGHPPAFALIRSEKKVHELMAGGLAIGFFDEGEYQSESCQLGNGDMLMMITDGISEGQNRALDQYGHHRVAEFLLSTDPADTAKKVLTKFIDNFLNFMEGRILKDDVTVLILKRTG